MKYALIGCGRIAARHLEAAQENHMEVVAVCDIVPDQIERFLEKHELQDAPIRKYTDYKKMIEENDLELVSIATASGTKAETALFCIDHGVHVIIEKPIALSLADIDRIIARAEEKQVKVAACHQNRFQLSVRKMRKAEEAGGFGKISHGTVHVRWNRNQDYYTQAPWRGTWAQDGGTLMNQCIHGIDILLWMMDDEVESVYGVTRQRFHSYLEAEDLGVAVVTFKNGAVATIEGSVNIYPKNLEETLYLFGESGTVKLGGKSMSDIEVWEFNEKEIMAMKGEEISASEESRDIPYGKGHISLFADMADAIKNDRTPYVDAMEGRKAVELILAIYKSQKTGQVVTLPLKDFSTEDMRGEFDG